MTQRNWNGPPIGAGERDPILSAAWSLLRDFPDGDVDEVVVEPYWSSRWRRTVRPPDADCAHVWCRRGERAIGTLVSHEVLRAIATSRAVLDVVVTRARLLEDRRDE